MRDIRFRAWAEHTIDNRWNYAWDKSEEEFSKLEPYKHSEEWEMWYQNKEDYRDQLLVEFDKQSIVDRYTNEKVMITDFKINGKIQRPYGYEIIDVMQYTGLKDKGNKGKEIFEGDVVIATTEEGEGIQGYIEYIDCAWMVNTDGITVYEFYNLRYPSIVVIGNIYENPELLEK